MFFLRRTSLPTLQEITAVPQIVVVDQTGPTVFLGTAPGLCCIVGEFTKGSLAGPVEVTSGGQQASLYGPVCYPYFSQDGTGIQNGLQASYNGNGNLQLLSRTFKRLAICRVDHEAVTTDGGTTKAQLSVTVTFAASDQDGASHTLRDTLIPAGTRFGSANTFAGSTRVFATSGDFTIPKGTTLTTNAVTVAINCFPIVVIEPVVATAIAAIVFVLDAVLPNVATTTTVTAVTNATTLWPNGTGTTLSARVESQYPKAINQTLPGNGITADIVHIWSARRSSALRIALANNAVASGAMGRGRTTSVAADPATAATIAGAAAATTAAIGLAAADGYAQPDTAQRVFIAFPQSKILVPDFGNIKVTIDSTGRMASTISNFPEEVNPGASNDFIQDIVELEDAYLVAPLVKQDYANLIAAGVCALYQDRVAGWQWMQGVTAANSVSFPTRTPIKRIRMADTIDDSLGDIAAPFLKQPATTERVDSLVSEIVAYLDNLKGVNTPGSQRIVDYKIDPDSGNTAQLQALGIYVILVYVRLLPSMDYIVFQTQIGETVTIPVTVLAGT